MAEQSSEIEVTAETVRPGDYLLGLGRVQSVTSGGKTATLHGEFSLWRVSVDARHRVVVLREGLRITHGRHCTCSACAREDWTNPDLACCGMHGEDCPALYQPLGRPGDLASPSPDPTKEEQ